MDKSYISLEEIKQKEKSKDLTNYLLEDLISKIRNHRIHQGFSQRELSRISGVTQNIISRMENLVAIPEFATMIKLIQALDLDIEIIIKSNKEKEDE